MSKEELLLYLTPHAGLAIWEAQSRFFNLMLQNEGRKMWALFGFETKQRTEAQNNALHLFCKWLAQTLSEAGLSVQEVLAKAMELDWTMYRVKENLWKPAQLKLIGTDSTTKLNKTDDIDLIHTHLIRHLGEKFSVIVPPWPNEQDRQMAMVKNQ